MNRWRRWEITSINTTIAGVRISQVPGRSKLHRITPMQVVNSSECPTGKHEQNLGVEKLRFHFTENEQDMKAHKRRDTFWMVL